MADFWEEYRKSGVQAAQTDPFWDAYRSGQQPAVEVQQSAPQIAGATPTDPNSVSSTLGRATDQLQANFGGGIEALGEFIGSDYLATMGETIRQENLEEAKQYGSPEKATWSEIEGVGDVPEYAKQLGLSAIPALGVVGAGAIAGARAGAGFGTVGATVGGAIGGLMSSLGMNVGEIQNRIKQENPDLEAPGTAIGTGAAMSVLDAVGAGVLLRPFIKRFGADYVYEGLVKQGLTKAAAAGAIKSAVAEGVTEVGQEAIGEAGTAQAIGRAFDTEAFLDRSVDAFFGGGLVGGGVGAVTGASGALYDNQRVSDQNIGDTTVGGVDSTDRVGPMKKAWYGIANRPTAVLEPLGNVSETAKDFLDTFRRDTSLTTQASKANIGEKQELMVGGWRSQIEDDLRTLSQQDVHDIATGSTVNPKAVAIRNTLDQVPEAARKAGLDVGKIDNYLPTNIDPQFVINNREQFVQDIAPFMTNTTKAGTKPASLAQVNKVVDEWLAVATNPDRDVVPVNIDKTFLDPVTLEAAKTRQYKGRPDTVRSKVAQGNVPPEFGQLEKARTFASVPQEVLLKYTQEGDNPTAVRQAIVDYLEGAAHRIAFAEEFGGRGEKANYKIARIVKEARDNGRDVSLEEVKRMYDLLDAYNNMHAQIGNRDLRAAQSVVGATVTATVLPLVLLSSMTEIVLPAIRGEIGVALGQIAPTIRTIAGEAVRRSFSNTPKSDISLLISQANLSLAAAENVMAARMGQNMYGQSASKFLRGFFRAVGLTHWTHFMRVYSAHVGKAIMDRNISELASGIPIDSPRGRYLRTQLAEMGLEVRSTNQAKQLNSPSTESERLALNEARLLGVRRFVEETILEPGFEDKPLWMSRGDMQLIAHLKGYPTMFTNTVLPQVIRRFDPRRVGGAYAASGFIGMVNVLAFMLLVGYMQDYMKQVIKNGDLNFDETRSEAQVALDVAQLTMMPMHLSYLTQAISAPRYGTSGFASIAGPTVGKIESAIKTISGFIEEPDEGDVWKFLYKEGTPFGFYRPGREIASELDLFGD